MSLIFLLKKIYYITKDLLINRSVGKMILSSVYTRWSKEMVNKVIKLILFLFLNTDEIFGFYSYASSEGKNISTHASFVPEYNTFETYDHLFLRTAKWSTPFQKKGTIVFMEGMGGFIESYERFCCWFVEKGFDVLAFDWRGQGASDRITLKDTLLHVDSFDDYIHDLEDLIDYCQEEIVGPIVFVASSMGGNIALRYVNDHPNMIDGLILLSPMIDINTYPYPYPIARGIAAVANQIGNGESFVFGYDTFSLESCLGKYDPTKHGNQEQYIRDCHTLHQRPNMAVGGPSFNWLLSAFHSCDELKECDFDNRVPILMVSVAKDHLVDTQAQLDLCSRLPSCQQILYSDDKTHHNLLHDDEPVFTRLTEDIEMFLRDHLNLF